MPSRSPRTPKYRLHKPTGQAVVTLNGRDIYLGRHGTEESRAKYDRLVAEWLLRGRQTVAKRGSSDLTVNELILGYIRHADGYYRKKGQPTRETINIRLALRPLRQLYGQTLAAEIDSLALKAARQAMIEADLCRNEVNKRTGIIVRAFKWAVEEKLVPPEAYIELKTVKPLQKDRSTARETEPVRPVSDADIDAIRPHVSRQVWAMIQLQRLTGMRPGEVTIMRTRDIDSTGRVWAYKPERHKTEHLGKERIIYLGPRAQEILRPWLRTDPTAYLFSPREALEEHWEERRRNRQTPMTPSQQARKKKIRRSRPVGLHYTTSSYGHAIAKGCEKAVIPGWHPHQLRHSAATWLRKEFGLDATRIILGHGSLAMTELYAEVDRNKAIDVMDRVG